jgi:dolichyl-phosphate beta-glucosyltransferase
VTPSNDPGSRPNLSVVIPAYNEDARIHRTLDRVVPYLRARGLPFEILIVDDGSSDRTAASVESRPEPEIAVIRLGRNSGKGAAVRRGALASRGALMLLTDADLSAPIEELERLEAALARGADVACGSRGLRDSQIVQSQPVYRRQMGNIFNHILRLLGLTSLHDTQCGFKLFRGEASREVFSRCSIDGFAFDVECLYLAERLGYRVAEVPVAWAHVPESRVRLTADSAHMLADALRIRLAAWMGRYPARADRQSP